MLMLIRLNDAGALNWHCNLESCPDLRAAVGVPEHISHWELTWRVALICEPRWVFRNTFLTGN